jgi:hypothetical protein
MSNLEQAYVYKWTHLPTLKWYVGRRTKKGCHINDGYICSSRVVKPLIKANPEEWQRTIIATGNVEEMIDFEADILETIDASNDPKSFNLTNGDGRFNHSLYPGPMTGKKHSAEAKARISAGGKGKTRSVEQRAKVSAALKGKPKSAEAIAKQRISQTGKKASAETRAKMSAAGKGHKNNTPESIAKCYATKLANGSHKHSAETVANLKAAGLRRRRILVSEIQELDIISRYIKGSGNSKQLAEEYNISPGQVLCIVNRTTEKQIKESNAL